MPPVTRGRTKKDSSDSSNDSPPSAHAAGPLAIAGPFGDGNANGDNNDGAAEEPRRGASEDPDRPQTTNARKSKKKLNRNNFPVITWDSCVDIREEARIFIKKRTQYEYQFLR